MGPVMCCIIKYTTLSDGNYTDLCTFRYCPYTWAVQPIRGVFHLGISLSYCLGSSGSSSVLFGVFTAEEVNRVGDKGSGDTTIFLYKHFRPFENIPEIFYWSFVSGKKKNFCSWDYTPQVPDYQGFSITKHQFKGVLLHLHTNKHIWQSLKLKDFNSFITGIQTLQPPCITLVATALQWLMAQRKQFL